MVKLGMHKVVMDNEDTYLFLVSRFTSLAFKRLSNSNEFVRAPLSEPVNLTKIAKEDSISIE